MLATEVVFFWGRFPQEKEPLREDTQLATEVVIFHSGVDLGSIWAPSQIGLGSNSDQSGVQFGSVWALFRIGLGSIPDRSGVHSGSVWAPFRINPGSIWDTLGSVWGQFGNAGSLGGPSGAQVC